MFYLEDHQVIQFFHSFFYIIIKRKLENIII